MLGKGMKSSQLWDPGGCCRRGPSSPRRNLRALGGSLPRGGWGWGALDPGWALLGGHFGST